MLDVCLQYRCMLPRAIQVSPTSLLPSPSLSGPSSCLLWVNRRPVGRLHTFLGPQTSLYVPDGFWQPENEVLLMMCASVF